MTTPRRRGITSAMSGDLSTALSYHQRGLLEEAARMYHVIIDRDPLHADARHLERAALEPFHQAERKAQRIETEVRTLEKLLNTQSSDLWPPVVDHIEVAKGYEAALGAALGDDLDASTNSSAPAHWSLLGSPDADPALPLGIAPLTVDIPGGGVAVLFRYGAVVLFGAATAALDNFTEPKAVWMNLAV